MVTMQWCAVVVVVGAATLVSAQLGEGRWEVDPKELIDYYEYGQEYDDIEDIDVGVGVSSWGGVVGGNHIWRPRTWLTPRETYQGCLDRVNIYGGTFLYVNLSEISSIYDEPGCAASCFRLCQNKMPFAEYITVTKGDNIITDTCACHYEQDLTFYYEEEDSICNGSPNHARVYCGAANVDCFNGVGVAAPWLALLLPLALLATLASPFAP